MIRRMWDVGLAHRDIKPANLMVQDGHLRLIDVFFVQVRPSPWRQAVDLGNMMLVLALRSDAGDGVREGNRVLHARGALRSVRCHAWRGEPDAAAQLHEARQPRPPGGVPGARASRVRPSRSSDGASGELG